MRVKGRRTFTRGRFFDFSAINLQCLAKKNHEDSEARTMHCDGRSFVANDTIPIKYLIKFEKDHTSVKASYDLSVPIGGLALIAGFQISVDGTDLISNFIPGQSRFNGAQFHTLSHPS